MNKTKKINLRSFRELLLVGVVIVLCMIWTIMNSQFLSANNISNILRQASYTAVSYTHLVQGYVISRPLPAEEFGKWFQRYENKTL